MFGHIYYLYLFGFIIQKGLLTYLILIYNLCAAVCLTAEALYFLAVLYRMADG